MSANKKAYLVLENGFVTEGQCFGAEGDVSGEIVFATGMTGYLETLTDPSYYGQIVLQTFPLIGNYGIIPSDFESVNIVPKAYIVKYPCQNPSNFRSEGNLDTFFKERGIVGLSGIDTRQVTKMIRDNGTMNGIIMKEPPTDKTFAELKSYTITNALAAVSTKSITMTGGGKRRVVLMDYGAKRGIAEALAARGCEVWTFPHDATYDEIMYAKPDGIMLSNGPGDPDEPANKPVIETLRQLMRSDVPIFGICMGHQLMALASGYSTQKLKFGHRGHNQPVKELATGRVYISSQNHGYTVVADKEKCSFINVNDGSCEGIEYGKSFSVQFHPEAKGGPLDTGFLFDRFIERIDKYAVK